MTEFAREDLTFENVDVVAMLKDELRRGMDYTLLDEWMGPALFGTGVEGEKNWKVEKDEATGEWVLLPADGRQPGGNLQGVLNAPGMSDTPYPWGWEKARAVKCKVPICQAEVGDPCQDARRVLDDGSFAPVSAHKRRKRDAKRYLENNS